MKPGDKVRIHADHIPGTGRQLPEGLSGTVLEIPEEYEGSVAVVHIDNWNRDYLPDGQGWTLRTSELEVYVDKLNGQVIRLASGHVVVPYRQPAGADGWACVVVVASGRHDLGSRMCVTEDELRAGAKLSCG